MKFSKKILINSVLVSILGLCGNFYINAKQCLHVTTSKHIFDTKSIFSNAEWNIIHHEIISKLSASNFDKFCKSELNELNFYRIYFKIDLLSPEVAAIATQHKINKIRIHY